MKPFAILATLCLPLVSMASGTKPLAGVSNGQTFTATMWEEVSTDTAGRVVTYAGYKAMQHAGIKNGRVYDVGLGFLVGNPASGAINPLQPGLTSTSTPTQTAKKVADAIRSQFRSEGFKRNPGTNPTNPNVEHYCAPGKNERTLLNRVEVPGQLHIVMVGALSKSNCP
jgi:hypothetical protein